MTLYSRLNNTIGALLFIIAGSVYFKTMEPTVSFWDCGEFIAASFGLQVGHQPGAPLFIMLGKLFSLAAPGPDRVAFMTNLISVLSSAATIMFLFWTITAMAKRLIAKNNEDMTMNQLITLFGAGTVGALSYTFSDTFWFSAVESEVYAFSSLITAVAFWAILKWEARGSDKWLVLIAYITGLSIGVHLLNLLTIPAITLVYYCKRTAVTSTKGAVIAFLCGCTIVGLIQFGVILYLIKTAFYADLFFVNSLHLPFGSGAVLFALLLAGALAMGIVHSLKTNKTKLNLALNCLAFILLGYSSYALIMIRAAAKPPVNISNPDNMFSMLEYLGREQYGSNPLIYGNYFDSQVIETKEGKTQYRKGARSYVPAGNDPEYVYEKNTFFPRIYSQRNDHPRAYRSWLGLAKDESAGFKDNIRFFASYQAGFMYWRYFLWNFAGRQNDNQGQGEIQNGNWITGIKNFDALRLGNQQHLPQSTISNAGYNRFYALPLILGIAGIIYQFRKNRKDTAVLGALFFCTGLAIVLYLNMDPSQVRERDYVFVGSFYAFAIWIGMGVIAFRALLARISPKSAGSIAAVVICLFAVPYLMGKEGWDDHDRGNRFTARDMAVNYLQSCAPNAILFANADNDTYPLWYAQHVEGIRTDVRVVNMQLLYDASYIDHMKTALEKSQPLPLTMQQEKYVRGTRDYIPFMDYGLTDSVELKDVLEVMLSDNDADKVELRDGGRTNFLPSKKWKLSVDANEVIRTGTLPASQAGSITNQMEWNYNKDYVTRSDLAVLDILVHNKWKRPVYFTIGLSSDTYLGLDNYLYNEGYAYRLLPLKRNVQDERDKTETANTLVLADNLMNKFSYSFKKANYLDPESRHIASMTWNVFNNAAESLANEGDLNYSRAVMNKAMSVLPLKDYSTSDTLNKYSAARNFYILGDTRHANQLLNSSVSFLGSELGYYASLDQSTQIGNRDSVQMIVSVMQACRKLAKVYKQQQVANRLDHIYEESAKGLVFSVQAD